MMIAIPMPFTIERNQKQIGLVEIRQQIDDAAWCSLSVFGTVRRVADRDKGLTGIRSLHRKPCPAKGLTGQGGPDAARRAHLREGDSSR